MEIEDLNEMSDARGDVSSFVEDLIFRHLVCEIQNDYLRVVRVQNLSQEVREALASMPEVYKNKGERLQSLYERAVQALGAQMTTNFTEHPVENIEGWLRKLLGNLDVQEDKNVDGYMFMSKNEVTQAARNMFLHSFIQRNNVTPILQEFGVSNEYQPTPEAVETAVLSAIMVLSLLQSSKEDNSKKSVLWTPGG